MPDTNAAALTLARALGTQHIENRSPLHAALIAQREADDARLVARVAALAGISLEELARRAMDDSATASAALAATRQDETETA